MPKPKKGPRLGGSPAHQRLILANLATQLFEHGRITTTESRARTLRRDQTDAERALWSRLRDRRLAEAKFVRQLPIGRYFADFACREAKLIVELDGSQHAESGYDRARDAWLVSQGWHVLRFWNGEVARNLIGVLETILASIVERRPSSSPRGRGEGRAAVQAARQARAANQRFAARVRGCFRRSLTRRDPLTLAPASPPLAAFPEREHSPLPARGSGGCDLSRFGRSWYQRNASVPQPRRHPAVSGPLPIFSPSEPNLGADSGARWQHSVASQWEFWPASSPSGGCPSQTYLEASCSPLPPPPVPPAFLEPPISRPCLSSSLQEARWKMIAFQHVLAIYLNPVHRPASSSR